MTIYTTETDRSLRTIRRINLEFAQRGWGPPFVLRKGKPRLAFGIDRILAVPEKRELLLSILAEHDAENPTTEGK